MVKERLLKAQKFSQRMKKETRDRIARLKKLNQEKLEFMNRLTEQEEDRKRTQREQRITQIKQSNLEKIQIRKQIRNQEMERGEELQEKLSNQKYFKAKPLYIRMQEDFEKNKITRGGRFQRRKRHNRFLTGASTKTSSMMVSIRSRVKKNRTAASSIFSGVMVNAAEKKTQKEIDKLNSQLEKLNHELQEKDNFKTEESIREAENSKIKKRILQNSGSLPVISRLKSRTTLKSKEQLNKERRTKKQ